MELASEGRWRETERSLSWAMEDRLLSQRTAELAPKSLRVGESDNFVQQGFIYFVASLLKDDR